LWAAKIGDADNQSLLVGDRGYVLGVTNTVCVYIYRTESCYDLAPEILDTELDLTPLVMLDRKKEKKVKLFTPQGLKIKGRKQASI